MPHGHCYFWSQDILWLHVVSNGLIALAYFAIPFGLFYFVKKRKDLIYKSVFILFGMFIIFCGLTHVMSIVTIWKPYYYFEGVLLLLTGIVSMATAIVLFRMIPEALYLPNPQELQKTKEQLEEEAHKKAEAVAANNMKSQFLANMSHDIRTPLNGILGSLELMEEADGDEEQQAQLRKITHDSAITLLGLINDVLDLAKIESGKVELRATPFNLRELVDGIAGMLRARARTKGLSLKIEFNPDATYNVSGDSSKLSQIVANLANNAIKFTDEGEVAINVHVEDETDDDICYSIAVHDTGMGIPPEKLDTIFETYSQAHDEVSIERGGVGLGLAISRKLARLMGGDIKVESEPGEGSIFTALVRLKKYDMAEEESATTKTSRAILRPKREGEPVRILVAEDNVSNMYIIRKHLERSRVKLDTVNNGIDAIEKFRENHYDAVIMDIRMPKMNGMTAIQHMREVESGRKFRTPILALTAYAMQHDHLEVISAGADAYLSKPFRRDDLLKIVGSLIESN